MLTAPRRTYALVGCIAALVAARSHAGDIVVRTVVKTADQVPRLVPYFFGGEFFPQMYDAWGNSAGSLAFSATLFGPDVTADNDDIYVIGPPGSLRIVARAGGQAPDVPVGVVFDQFALAQVNPGGRAMLPVILRGGGTTTASDTAIFLESRPPFPPGGSLALLIREGDPVPGLSGFTVGVIPVIESGISDGDAVALACTIVGLGVNSSNNSVLLRSTPAQPGVLELLARAGDQVPGQAAGVNYGTFAAPNWTPAGDLYARSILAGPAVTSATDTAFLLFPGGNGPPTVLVREGVPIGPQSFSGLYVSLATSIHEMMFYGRPTPSTAGLFVGPVGPGPFHATAQTGSSASGLPDGVTIDDPNLGKFQFNSDRRAAYIATITGPNVTTATDTAVFSEGPLGRNTPMLLAREGSPIVGVDPSAFLASLASPFATVGLNRRNQTAFFGLISGPGITANSDNALWAAGSDGTLMLVAREGGPLTLSPGDTRIIQKIGYRVCTNCARPNTQWFTDRGEILCAMTFTDGTGAIIVFELDPLCPADFNNDDVSSLQDLFDFFGAWFAGDSAADFNGVGGVTLQDLFDFLSAWFVGCE